MILWLHGYLWCLGPVRKIKTYSAIFLTAALTVISRNWSKPETPSPMVDWACEMDSLSHVEHMVSWENLSSETRTIMRGLCGITLDMPRKFPRISLKSPSLFYLLGNEVECLRVTSDTLLEIVGNSQISRKCDFWGATQKYSIFIQS